MKLCVMTHSLINRNISNYKISIQTASRLFLQQLEHKDNEAHNNISYNIIASRTIN